MNNSNIKEAAVVFILKDNKILSISRRDSTKFGLPGGKCEPNEAPVLAAIREVKEETSLTIKDLVFVYRREEPPESPGGETFYTYCFLANTWSGEPKSMEEGLLVEWLSPEELIGDKGAFPVYNRNALKAMRDYFKKLKFKYPDDL